MTPRRRSRSGSGTITTRPTPSWRSSGARSTSPPWTRGPRRRSSSSRSGSASACRRTSRETGHPKLREIAVFGGTRAPGAGRRDLRGPERPVRGEPGQQRRCLAVLPSRGAGQREPLHDESPDELGQGREDVEDQPAARGGGVQRLVQGPEPSAAAAQPGHDGDQVLQGPAQPVQARDDEGVVGAEVVRARGELETANGLARLLASEDPDAAGPDTRRLGARPRHRTDIPPSASSAGHRSRPRHSTGTHPPQRGAGTHGAAAFAVTGPPLSRWTQPCACRFALYWLRAATRASPAASTTSVDDARTATLRPGSSTSSSTSPTASLPGPTE